MSLATLQGPLALIGAGKMGFAMVQGWLGTGLAPDRVQIFEPAPSEAVRQMGVSVNPPQTPAQIVVVAVKPQVMAEVLPGYAGLVGPETLVLSIAAGCSCAQLSALLGGHDRIVRVMPNTPAAVGAGMSVAYAAPAVAEADKAICTALLEAVGAVGWIDIETDMDAVTAVSGSGPAYLFYLVEALAAAGEAAGLETALASQLARQTVIGSARLLAESGESAEQLRRNVTSPGGTTQAALAVLMQGLPPLMTQTVLAAKRRSEELAGGS